MESLVRFTQGGGGARSTPGRRCTRRRSCPSSPATPDAFFNANTLAELHRLERHDRRRLRCRRSPPHRRATTRRRCRSRRRRSSSPAWSPRVQAVEKVALRDALGRVLAEDIVSPIDVPPHDNSAMDGYAFDGSELADGRRVACSEVAGAGFAGQAVRAAPWARGECVQDHDRRDHAGRARHRRAAGVLQRRWRRASRVPPGLVRRGDNRRLAGEDLAQGEAALAAGRSARAAPPRPARQARPRPRWRSCAACASPTSPPATRS